MPFLSKASLLPTSKSQYAFAAGMGTLALILIFLNGATLTRQPTGDVVARISKRVVNLVSPAPNLIREATLEARELFLQRQEAYQNAKRNDTPTIITMQGRGLDETNVQDTWRMRGMGYAFARHGVIFAALLPETPLSPGWNAVRIFNTFEATKVDCDKWTIFVRVNGPEIFAGSALPVASQIYPGQSCHWEFPFNLQVPGEYEVDARLLNYNGNAPPQGDGVRELCEAQQNFDIPLDNHPYSTGFLGFKFYRPLESCCEICSREPLCKYWVSPALSLTPGSAVWAGCELFFDSPVDSLDRARLTRRLRQRHLLNVHIPANESKLHPHFRSIKNMTGIAYQDGLPKVFHGKPHPIETSYFLGCGWSFWHTQSYPCLNSSLDDAVPVFPSSQFALATATRPTKKEVLKRMCVLPDEYPRGRFSTMTESGRWVRYPWPNETECPHEMQSESSNEMFEITQFDADHPTCWYRDDLSTIGKSCTEYCAHEYHVPWLSSIKMEKQHYSLWENYNCDYLELTNNQLQQCVDGRKIKAFQVQGASISRFMNAFLTIRLKNISLYVPSENEAAPDDNRTQPLTVTLSTFYVPHLLWHLTTSQQREHLEAARLVGENEESYFLTGYYYTSEREPWVTVDHADWLAKAMQEILVPKGWRMINGFDISAAFTYEVATQGDGLHMIGGPAKMVITKLFHYLCKDYMGQER
jgi:hypothetical protein